MSRLSLLQRLRAWIAPPARPASAQRLYSGARHTNSTFGFGASNTSADAELSGALTLLRSRSRALMRDSPYAKRARTIIVNNVVGAGVGMQAQVLNTRGKPAKVVNDSIESAWREWARAENCHTGGALHFSDLERVALSEVVAAGEVLIRKHTRTFGASPVPLALELIEAECLASDFVGVIGDGNTLRMGVEIDSFGRPAAYWLRESHPGDTRWAAANRSNAVRVPAHEIIHLRLVDRWPQTRGEPWLHSVLRKLDDMSQYSASELEAARASSYFFGTIESGEETNPLATVPADGQVPAALEIEPGVMQQLAPGEKLKFHSPTRPNAALDQFLRHMLREVAAGIGVSYESLSRDYSQSNYSSSRLALLDDRDLWRMLQQWWVRSFREPLHRQWVNLAVMSRAAAAVPADAYLSDRERYAVATFKCRGWSWVDPVKEVNAFKEAVRAGFTTVTDVISQTAGGMDLEDVLATRARELELMKEADLSFDTQMPGADSMPPEPPDGSDDEKPKTARQARVVSFGR